MSTQTKVILACIFLMMFASQSLYQYNSKENITFNIYNFTENKIIWNYTLEKDGIANNFSDITGLNYTQIQSGRVTNIIHKTIDWGGYTIFEIMKWSLEFGYTHPQYNFKFFMYFMMVTMLLPFIIPLIVLIYLTIIGIKSICLRIQAKSKTHILRTKQQQK